MIGSKKVPSKLDCYNMAEEDEPRFTLLGRDLLAPYLVAIWANIRCGNYTYADSLYRSMVNAAQRAPREQASIDIKSVAEQAQVDEALAIGGAMFMWRGDQQRAMKPD